MIGVSRAHMYTYAYQEAMWLSGGYVAIRRLCGYQEAMWL